MQTMQNIKRSLHAWLAIENKEKVSYLKTGDNVNNEWLASFQ